MPNHLAGRTQGSVRTTGKWLIGFVVLASVVLAILLGQPQPQNSNSTTTDRPPVAFSATPTPVSTPTESFSAEPFVTPTPVAPTESPARVIPDETAKAKAEAIPPKAEPTHISIPDANISMSVSVLPQSSFKGQDLVPPDTPDAYWVSSFDQPGVNATDMTMIIAHACDGLAICDRLDWQFSRLSDRNLVKKGTEVVVQTANGNVCYTVDDDPATYDKSTFYKQVAVYGSGPRPDKLVLVSCYTADIYEQNVAAVASIKPCGS